MRRVLSALWLASSLANAAPLTQTLVDTMADSTAHQYLLSLPTHHAKKSRWPLVLFLHGAGERGTELELTRGWPQLVKQLHNKAILVAPQIPYEDLAWSTELLSRLLDRLEQQYDIDPSRIYLTGYSLGGFGSLALARAEPTRFAAIVSVAGGDPDLLGVADVGLPAQPLQQKAYCAFANTPVWLAHGAQDPLVPSSLSVEIKDALTACGAKPRLKLYPKLDHNLAEPAYNDPSLLRWLLAQKNPQASAQAKVAPVLNPAYQGHYQLANNRLTLSYEQQQLWISVDHLGEDNPEFLRNHRRFLAHPLATGRYSSQLGFIEFSPDGQRLSLGRIGTFSKQP